MAHLGPTLPASSRAKVRAAAPLRGTSWMIRIVAPRPRDSERRATGRVSDATTLSSAREVRGTSPGSSYRASACRSSRHVEGLVRRDPDGATRRDRGWGGNGLAGGAERLTDGAVAMHEAKLGPCHERRLTAREGRGKHQRGARVRPEHATFLDRGEGSAEQVDPAATTVDRWLEDLERNGDAGEHYTRARGRSLQRQPTAARPSARMA